jgi:hypothetical protein
MTARADREGAKVAAEQRCRASHPGRPRSARAGRSISAVAFAC